MWVQTLVNLTANTSRTLIAANPNRQRMRWMVTGTGAITVVPGLATVIAAQGMVYNGAPSSGQEGSSDDFQFDTSRQDFSAISTTDTSVVVWEYVANLGIKAANNYNLGATP